MVQSNRKVFVCWKETVKVHHQLSPLILNIYFFHIQVEGKLLYSNFEYDFPICLKKLFQLERP
jgi:hypothetical protein